MFWKKIKGFLHLFTFFVYVHRILQISAKYVSNFPAVLRRILPAAKFVSAPLHAGFRWQPGGTASASAGAAVPYAHVDAAAEVWYSRRKSRRLHRRAKLICKARVQRASLPADMPQHTRAKSAAALKAIRTGFRPCAAFFRQRGRRADSPRAAELPPQPYSTRPIGQYMSAAPPPQASRKLLQVFRKISRKTRSHASGSSPFIQILCGEMKKYQPITAENRPFGQSFDKIFLFPQYSTRFCMILP